MEQQAYVEFLGTWTLIMWGLTALSIFVSIFLFLAYKVRFGAQKSLKDKFDLASETEVKTYLRCISYLQLQFSSSPILPAKIRWSLAWSGSLSESSLLSVLPPSTVM